MYMYVKCEKSVISYIIVHGSPQHNGRQIGTTAAPELLLLFDLLSASYMYFPLPLAYPPCKEKIKMKSG